MDLRPMHLVDEVRKKDVGNKGSELAREQAIIIGTHEHYKGGIYQVIMKCEHSESGEMLVIRKHLWPYEYSVKAVPRDIFLQEIAPGLPRYRYIHDAEKDLAGRAFLKKYIEENAS